MDRNLPTFFAPSAEGTQSITRFFSIFNMYIHSEDIRGQNLKLSEIAPNFESFLFLMFLFKREQKLYSNCHAYILSSHVEKFCDVRPTPLASMLSAHIL